MAVEVPVGLRHRNSGNDIRGERKRRRVGTGSHLRRKQVGFAVTAATRGDDGNVSGQAPLNFQKSKIEKLEKFVKNTIF